MLVSSIQALRESTVSDLGPRLSSTNNQLISNSGWVGLSPKILNSFANYASGLSLTRCFHFLFEKVTWFDHFGQCQIRQLP